jgi:hypothetical protein
MFSERVFEKMYNGSRAKPALERGVTQADESRRRGVIMEAIAGVDIAVWDVKAQALGIPLYQALGALRSSVRGYASGGWAPGDEAEAELAGYAAKGFTGVGLDSTVILLANSSARSGFSCRSAIVPFRNSDHVDSGGCDDMLQSGLGPPDISASAQAASAGCL